MKITLHKDHLLPLLALAQGVIERKTIAPILSHVLLRAEKDHLKLCATNLDLTLEATIPCVVHEESSFTVHGSTFYEVARKCDGPLDVEHDGIKNQTIIKAGKAQFTLPGLPVDRFTLPRLEGLPHRFTLPSGELKRLFDKTRIFASTEESRYSMNGIYLHLYGNPSVLRAVATDGQRLAFADSSSPGAILDMPGVIVPRKTAQEVLKMIEEEQGDITLSLSLTQILFEFSNKKLMSRLIDASYPNYEEAIAPCQGEPLVLEKEPFRQALERVFVFSQEKTHGVHMVLEKNIMHLSSARSEMGSGAEEIDISYKGPCIKTVVNGRYFLEMLGHLDSPSFLFHYDPSSKRIMIQGQEEPLTTFIFIAMD